MSKADDYRRIQQQFAAHIRDPEQNKAPDNIEPRRLAVYRRLVFNNVKGFVEEAFPVLWRLWGEQQLDQEVTAFLAHHKSESPYFIDIAEEFLQYLIEERQSQPHDPAFLVELAHYEWIEFEVAFCQANRLVKPLLPDDIELDTPVELSETARPLQYQFPVHQIRPDFQPTEPGPHPVFLVVYRFDDDVKFLEINVMTARLLQLLAEKPGCTIDYLIRQMQYLGEGFSAEQIKQGLLTVIRDLAERGIVKRAVQPQHYD